MCSWTPQCIALFKCSSAFKKMFSVWEDLQNIIFLVEGTKLYQVLCFTYDTKSRQSHFLILSVENLLGPFLSNLCLRLSGGFKARAKFKSLCTRPTSQFSNSKQIDHSQWVPTPPKKIKCVFFLQLGTISALSMMLITISIVLTFYDQ